MSETQSSYRQALKATSLFGGVQGVNIVISIIRSKFVAVLLGPLGMGIAGLLNSTINVVGEFAKLGLDTSAVKEIALFNNKDQKKLILIVSSLKRIIWFTGLLSSVFAIIFASFLSRLTFGNTDYTWSFIWISVALVFKQLTYGELAVLQGLRKLKYLAKSNVYASFVGLFVVIPLYYFFKIDGIVPGIILSAILSYVFSRYFSHKVKIKSLKLSNRQAFRHGRPMLKLGLMLSIRSSITLLSAYGIQIFISHVGGIDEVGFYLAGFVIINSYVGVIFNAMQTDYFPRLSAMTNDPGRLRDTVLHQAVIALLIITPIIILFFMVAPIAIELLYSKEFLLITVFVSWGMFGTFFKAVSWAMGYVILAKGDSKLFIKTAVLFNFIYVTSLILGYTYYGLFGVGFAFFCYNILHLIIVKVITFYKYDLYFNRNFHWLFVICLLMCSTTFALSYLTIPLLKYSLMMLMVFISLTFTLYQLNKKLDIKAVLQQFLKKKND
ncbi:MAG: O-antigen translocase [Gelidibacter sp.]